METIAFGEKSQLKNGTKTLADGPDQHLFYVIKNWNL